MIALTEDGKRFTIYAFISTQYRRWTDRQTDGHKWYNNIALCMPANADAR